jgi:hypothetical protein
MHKEFKTNSLHEFSTNVQFVFLDLDLLMKIQATTCITPRALDNLVTLKRKRQLRQTERGQKVPIANILTFLFFIQL